MVTQYEKVGNSYLSAVMTRRSNVNAGRTIQVCQNVNNSKIIKSTVLTED